MGGSFLFSLYSISLSLMHIQDHIVNSREIQTDDCSCPLPSLTSRTLSASHLPDPFALLRAGMAGSCR